MVDFSDWNPSADYERFVPWAPVAAIGMGVAMLAIIPAAIVFRAFLEIGRAHV